MVSANPKTPVEYAFQEDASKSIIALLKAGAKIPKMIDLMTPLSHAAKLRRSFSPMYQVIYALYDRGVAPEFETLNSQFTYSTLPSDVTIALLSKKQILVTTEKSLIHRAIERNISIKVIRAMLTHLTNIDVKHDSLTILQLAAKKHPTAVPEILKYKPDVNTSTPKGHTPLFFLINNKDASLVDAILKAGANPYATIPAIGMSALAYAERLAQKNSKYQAVYATLQHHIQVGS